MTIELKLKYCPECGAHVKKHYGQGLLYQAITWRCTNRRCAMFRTWRPLDGWNERGTPSPKAFLLGVWWNVCWKIKCFWYEKISNAIHMDS